ncbi:MAG: hypothetical protein Q9198_007234, partial [Flavoplaca austrocitrina]
TLQARSSTTWNERAGNDGTEKVADRNTGLTLPKSGVARLAKKNAGGIIGTNLLTKVEDMRGLISPVRDAVPRSTSSGGLKRDVSSPAVLRSMSASPAVPGRTPIAHAQYFVHAIDMGRMMVIIAMRNTVRMWKLTTTTTTSSLAAVHVLGFSVGNLMKEATKTNMSVYQLQHEAGL